MLFARKKKKKNIVSGNGFSMHRPLEVKMLVLLFPHSVMTIRGGSDRVCSFVELRTTTSNVSWVYKVSIFDKSNYEGSNCLQGGGGGPRKATLGCKSLLFRKGGPRKATLYGCKSFHFGKGGRGAIIFGFFFF